MLDLAARSIKYLPGVGEQRATLLGRELNIHSLYDLLYYFPYKYIDRSRLFTVAELTGSMPHVQLCGEIRSFEEMGEGASRRIGAHFTALNWARNILSLVSRRSLTAE